MLWFKKYDIQDWADRSKNTIHDSLGIEILEVGDDFISGRMPIDKRTFQPMGILHGGASVVLAESLGSIASAMVVDPHKYYVVGQVVNANHVRPGIKGYATGVAKMVHLGSRSHIWEILITNDEQKLLCTVRLTMAVVGK